jgi:hypothetical protein
MCLKLGRQEVVGRIDVAHNMTCEHGYKTSGSLKSGVFFHYLSDYQILEMDSAS